MPTDSLHTYRYVFQSVTHTERSWQDSRAIYCTVFGNSSACLMYRELELEWTKLAMHMATVHVQGLQFSA